MAGKNALPSAAASASLSPGTPGTVLANAPPAANASPFTTRRRLIRYRSRSRSSAAIVSSSCDLGDRLPSGLHQVEAERHLWMHVDERVVGVVRERHRRALGDEHVLRAL